MNRLAIFDDIARTDAKPARNGESQARFHNRAAGPVFDRIRALLEDWLDRYPEAGRADLRGRLRSNSDATFGGAFWELYQYSTFERMGFDVSLHPEVPGTTRRPDFLVRRQGERGFYVEATLAGPSADERAAEQRLGTVIDAINDLSTPNFFLELRVRRQGPKSPPTRQLRADLTTWLSRIDPDAMIASGNPYGRDHEYVWDAAGWQLRFRPIAKAPGARGRPGRAIGLSTTGAHFVDSRGRLRQAIREKGGRYGIPDRPYVLAVLMDDFGVEREDIFDALFGTVAYRIPLDEGHEAVPFRQRDGSWLSRGPQYTRLSAVLTVANVAPNSLASIAPIVWLNPWAARPMVDRLTWETIRVHPTEGTADEMNALRSPGDLLGLPDNWPGPENPFPRIAT